MLKNIRAALAALLVAICVFPQAACAAPAPTTTTFTAGSNIGIIAANKRKSTSLIASPLRLGINFSEPSWWIYAPPLNDIAIAAPGCNSGEPGGILGSTSCLSIPDANRDASGNVKSVPAGDAAVSIAENLPATTAQRKITWSCQVSAPCASSLSINNSSGAVVDLANSNATYTPTGTQSNGNPPPNIIYVPSSTSNYPINFTDRPAVDSGAVLGPEFTSVIAADTTPSKIIRFMKYTTVERDNSPIWMGQGVTTHAGAAISSITFSGTTATVTTATAHGLLGNGTGSGSASITVTGATPTTYNVTDAYVNNIDATHFSYTMAGTPTGNATVVGSYTVGDANFQFTNVHFPVAANEPGTQLTEPIYTSLNRNKNKADGEWHDGVPVETLAQIAAAANANAWYNAPWNADGTFYTAAANVWANFAATNNRDVYLEVSNEVWNSGYKVMHQAFAEATLSGITLDQRLAQKTIEVANYFRTAFASAGASSHLHVVLAWQNYASPATWSSMSTFLGTTDWAKITDLAVAPYYGDNGGTILTAAGIGPGYTGSTTTLKNAISADIDDTVSRLVGHEVAAQALGKRIITYEAGSTIVLTDQTYGKAFERSSDAYDLELKFLQQLELKSATTQTGGLDLLTFNLSYPAGSNGYYWGQVEYLSQTLSKATTPKLWAHVDFKAGIRVLAAASGTLNDVPSTSPVGTSLGFLTPSAYGVTWSLTNNDGNRVAIAPATGEVTVASGLAGTANGARSLTARQAIGTNTLDTIFSYNVAALFQDNFNDNSRDTSLWNLAGYQEELTAYHGTASEVNNRLEAIPTAGSAGSAGYVSNVRNLTGKAEFIHLANIPPVTHDTEAYFSVGMPGAASYMTFVMQGSRLKVVRRQSATSTTFGDTTTTLTGTTAIWMEIKHNSSTGSLDFYYAPDSASNPPASGDWTLLSSVPSTSLPTGFDITATVVAFGAYTWDGDIPSGSPAYFDGFNTAQ